MRGFAILLAKLKQNAYEEYYREKIAEYGSNKAKTWRTINEIIKRKKKGLPLTLIIDKDGKRLEKTIEIANGLNLHFSEIGKCMATENESCNEGDIKDPLEYLPSTPLPNTFHTSNTDLSEIIDSLRDLDPKKSCGYDMITNRVLRETSFIIAPYLIKLFNNCIEKAVFPDCFKIAKVTPLFKGGDKHDPNSYRPISLLPCLGKLLEKLLSKRFISFLNQSLKNLHQKSTHACLVSSDLKALSLLLAHISGLSKFHPIKKLEISRIFAK